MRVSCFNIFNDLLSTTTPTLGLLKWLNEVLSFNIAELAPDIDIQDAVRDKMEQLSLVVPVLDQEQQARGYIRNIAARKESDDIRKEALRLIRKLDDQEAYPLVLDIVNDQFLNDELVAEALITLYGLDPKLEKQETQAAFISANQTTSSPIRTSLNVLFRHFENVRELLLDQDQV